MKTTNYWNDVSILKQANVQVVSIDLETLNQQTLQEPKWLHFGGGNLFRAFHAEIAQDLIELGEMDSGIIVCETFDEQVIDEIYRPFDNQFIQVVMEENGQLKKRLIQSVRASFAYGIDREYANQQIVQLIANPTLQLVTVSITEKAYGLVDSTGEYLDIVKQDFISGPDQVKHTMSIITSLLYQRFKAGKQPIALVSTDNFSKNGLKFKQAVVEIATKWYEHEKVERDFLQYITNEALVSFPWSMIDRITPNPSKEVAQLLINAGIPEIKCLKTEKNTNIASFVNTEASHYLVIEDNFPNGRPDLTKAGVILTDRQTVDKADAMKVTTCLNPLHTALAIFGCLLGYDSIADEMKDIQLVQLIKGIGYKEGLPVVDDPNIINPNQFIAELLEKRLPNPLIPDTPQRIATDTSQKLAIRYGETIKKYMSQGKSENLTYIPLVIAGWLRYLIGIDDNGKPFNLSPDPLKLELQEKLKGITIENSQELKNVIEPILRNKQLFGVDLYEAHLEHKIEQYLQEMLSGTGAIRQTLQKYVMEV